MSEVVKLAVSEGITKLIGERWQGKQGAAGEHWRPPWITQCATGELGTVQPRMETGSSGGGQEHLWGGGERSLCQAELV